MKLVKSGCMIVGGLLLIFLSVTAFIAITAADKAANSVRSEMEKPKRELTMQHFNQLQMGMTPEQVEQLLGVPGTEQASSAVAVQGMQSTSTVRSYAGEGFMPGTITVVYSDGRAVSKAQIGLKNDLPKN